MSKPQTDIFGDPQTEPSMASADLQWEADDSFDGIDGGDDEGPLPSDEEDAVTSTEAPATDDDDTTEDGADEDEDKGDDAPEPKAENTEDIPDWLQGKTEAELRKIAIDAQQMVAKQGNEIGTLRQAVEAIQAAQAAEQNQPTELAPAADYIHDEQDGILAYREAIAMLDRGEVGPRAIDDIIDVVREISPFTAAKMDRDFGMRLARAEMNAQMAPVIQQSYNASLTAATQQVNADPDAEAYREDIVRIVQQPRTLIEQQVAVAYQQARSTPDIAAALTAALTVARGANPVKAASYKTQLETAKQNETVESGNAAPPAKQLTDEERIINSFLKPADPSTNLFAGFGSGG